MEIEILDKRFVKRTVAEGNIAQFQLAVEPFGSVGSQLNIVLESNVNVVIANVVKSLHLHFSGLKSGTETKKRANGSLKAGH